MKCFGTLQRLIIEYKKYIFQKQIETLNGELILNIYFRSWAGGRFFL